MDRGSLRENEKTLFWKGSFMLAVDVAFNVGKIRKQLSNITSTNQVLHLIMFYIIFSTFHGLWRRSGWDNGGSHFPFAAFLASRVEVLAHFISISVSQPKSAYSSSSLSCYKTAPFLSSNHCNLLGMFRNDCRWCSSRVMQPDCRKLMESREDSSDLIKV